LKITGTDKLRAALDPKRFDALLRQNVHRANQLNGAVAARAMRQTIQQVVPPKNAALTQALKGSDKPLIDSATLWHNITWKDTAWNNVFIGTLRADKTFNVAVTVHNGASVLVTPKMRGLFFRLWKAAQDSRTADSLTGRAADLFERYQGWLPLNASTSYIVIPERPYVQMTFNDQSLKDVIVKNWQLAVQASFTAAAAQAGAT
jgi:hypothetical protein